MADFALRDVARGTLVRARDLRGRVVLLTFLDSQCTESCPVIAFQVARGLDHLGADERGQVEAIAISTDPKEDTPATVRAFLRNQHALGELRFVEGPLPELRRVWARFHVLSSLESGKDTLHSAPVRIYDRAGNWVSTLHPGVDLTQANLLHDIGVALNA
ncbi:MAG TPA: SCO family protein [Gaiellaceae bacterium]|nr:SCO family protein [Gaiellaceae bacterium]